MKKTRKNITIAVLPFKVLSGDPRVNTLFEGFVEDLITSFSKFVGLSVISSFSTNQLGSNPAQKKISKLGADYIVSGNVRHQKDNIRLSIQLIKLDDSSLVFADSYDLTLESLFEIQDRIIQQVVTILQEKINFSLLSHSYKKNTVELAAYENYLIGMHTLMKGSMDNDKKSRHYFEAAIKIDPNYSLAYTGLALSYFNFWSCLLWERWDESMQGAHDYALKAVELDPNDYIALGVLGRTYVYKGAYEKAEHYLRKSIRMNPNDTTNLLRVAYSLLYLGYTSEAVKLYTKAIEINPLHLEHYFAYGASFYLESGDFEKSIDLSKKVKSTVWTDFPAVVAAAYLQTGEIDELWKNWEIYLQQFKAAAYTGKKDLCTEAIEWLITLNPFKGFTYLSALGDYIKKHKDISTKVEASETQEETTCFLFKEGIWKIHYNGKTTFHKNAKGFHDIHKLLSFPNQEFHCLDLMGAATDERNTIASVDAKAKSQYLNRINELQQDIQEAEDMNQIETVSRLQEEYDALLEHLSSSLGMGGKTRKLSSTMEKARSAITWRIRNTIKKIDKTHPELGKHLGNSIKTGVQCVYRPEVPLEWVL